MMFQWTDGEVSHVVRLAFESLRSSASSFSAAHRCRLVEALAGELSASAWHAHTIKTELVARDRQAAWTTVATDLRHDWSEFCPFEYYGRELGRMLTAVEESGCPGEELAHRECQSPAFGDQPTESFHALAWLAVQGDGNCACVEFLKRAGQGPFTLRDEAVLRILSTELFAEPSSAAAAGGKLAEHPFAPDSLDVAELAELPRRQREVLAGLLAGSSVKEIACELGISPYTVNDYIKALYRRYHVSSRGELMASFHGLRRPAVPK